MSSITLASEEASDKFLHLLDKLLVASESELVSIASASGSYSCDNYYTQRLARNFLTPSTKWEQYWEWSLHQSAGALVEVVDTGLEQHGAKLSASGLQHWDLENILYTGLFFLLPSAKVSALFTST